MLKNTSFEKITSFLLGSSWAFILAGSALVFHTFSFFSFTSALLATFVYVFFSFFLILAIDAFVVNRKLLEEEKKQTQLLEALLSKNPQTLSEDKLDSL